MGMRAAICAARSLEFESISISTRLWFSTQVLSSPADLGLADTDVDGKKMTPNSLREATKKLKAVCRVSEIGPTGTLPPQTRYLIETIGMELDQIKKIAHRFPSFPYCTLEGKVKPIVKFLLDLGVPKSNIPSILFRNPQLCAFSLSENIIPTMTFLEGFGVDKTRWAKVIHRSPMLVSYSRQKTQCTVDFLFEMGVSKQNIGKILTRCPAIIGSSVEEKLRPNVDYFRSLGVDVSILLYRCPNIFCLSIESNLKPVTEFFLDKGFSIEEIGAMVSRFGPLYSLGLVQSLIPKWEFFFTTDYPKSDLVKFPQYFGYRLEERIKPRYAVLKESGVKLALATMLSKPNSNFAKVVQLKIAKMHSKKAIPEQG